MENFVKTADDRKWLDGFYKSFVYIEPGAAEFLVQRAVRLVGIDYLSIDEFQSEKHPAHFVLPAGFVVVVAKDRKDTQWRDEVSYTVHNCRNVGGVACNKIPEQSNDVRIQSIAH